MSALTDAIMQLRDLVWEDYPESQDGMIGSPEEVVLCAVDFIKRAKGIINDR